MTTLSKIFLDQVIFVSTFGNGFILPALVLILVTLALVIYKKHRDILFLALSTLSYGYSLVLKEIFKSPRPSLDNVIIRFSADKYSFPSSHVVFYVAFWGFILYLTLKLKKMPLALRIIVSLICIYFIVLIGISRVVLGVHWPSDVYGGYFFGAIYLLLLVLADNKFTNN